MKGKTSKGKTGLKNKTKVKFTGGSDGGYGGTRLESNSYEMTKYVLLIFAALVIGFSLCYLFMINTKKQLIKEEVVLKQSRVSESPYIPVSQERPSTMNYPLQQPLKQIAVPVYPTSPPEYPLRGVHTGFQQIGVLVLTNQEFEKPDVSQPDQNEEKTRLMNNMPEPVLLPLYGRKLDSNNQRWEYYCGSDKYNSMRLPVYYGNRDCQNDTGCNEIYDGDHVSVPDYTQKSFRARIYKYNTFNAM